MSDLQQMTAKWLDAETRANDLAAENFRLQGELGELRMRYEMERFTAVVSQELARGFARAMVSP